MNGKRFVVVSALASVLAVCATPVHATQDSAHDNSSDYVSADLPNVLNAGESIENDTEGDQLLIDLYQFTLTDPSASASDKAAAKEEVAKLGVNTSQNGAALAAAPQALCPVSVPVSILSGDRLASQNSVAPQAACGIKVPPTSARVSVTWVKQSNGYYCGPAAAYMAIKQRGVTTSKDGAKKSLTQANLAGAGYLNTTSSAGTPWAAKRMHKTLNTWTRTNVWKATNAPATESARVTALKSAFKTNIGLQKRTVLVNAVEYKGGQHYNGHPDKTIGHWMVGYAYSGSGGTISFADSATGLSGYKGKQKFSISTTTFAKFLNNGIVA